MSCTLVAGRGTVRVVLLRIRHACDGLDWTRAAVFPRRLCPRHSLWVAVQPLLGARDFGVVCPVESSKIQISLLFLCKSSKN